jgi:release factor glutamine methyltransferase
LDLQVTPHVLVPRPETELIVERALQLVPEAEERSVLDLGTGSGAIALSIATDRPRAHVTGSDVSASALNVARANAKRLGLKHIEWQLCSWFDALGGRRFDLIACNPPYVAAADPHLAALHAEPPLALTPGTTGLEAYQAIIPAAAEHLTARGWLVFEHGATQAPAIANMLEHQGFHNVTSHRDYAGRPRMTLASLHPSTQGSS